MIGHLQAVGHVAGERDVEDGGADAVVLDDIYDGGDEGARLPGKGAAGLENHTEMGPAGMEVAQGLDEEVGVVVRTGHEVTAAEVDPLQTGEPGGELIYNMYERAREGLGAALAVAVDMESFDGGGKVFGGGEVAGEDAEAGAGGAGVVELGLYLAVFGVDRKRHV